VLIGIDFQFICYAISQQLFLELTFCPSIISYF